MSKSVTLPAGDSDSDARRPATTSRTDWDYAYLIVSTDGGANFDTVHDQPLDERPARTARTSATGSPASSTGARGST